MSDIHYITSYCLFKSGKVVLNGEQVYTENKESDIDFIKLVYKEAGISYPKFYKMDRLCRLAFITSELLLKANHLTEKYNGDDIGITIANSASSLEIDTEHQKTISDRDNFFPSPAIFVYTLPNIMIGEIAIRNSIKGENSLFIFEHFNSQFMSAYTDALIKNGKTEACISGYVDVYENSCEAFLYTVEKTPGILGMEHTTENLNQLYKQ
jgi:hypothetical protein